MFARKILAAALLTSAAAIPLISSPAASRAAERGAERAGRPCAFHGRQVTAVRPYEVATRTGKGSTVMRLKGAHIYVQAEPGLTAEWLQLQLSRHVAQMKSNGMSNCALAVDDITTHVASAGAGFWVTLSAPNEEKAAEVLSRARLLLTQ